MEALGEWGSRAVEADTVASALATFDAEEPSAILLDIDLPAPGSMPCYGLKKLESSAEAAG